MSVSAGLAIGHICSFVLNTAVHALRSAGAARDIVIHRTGCAVAVRCVVLHAVVFVKRPADRSVQPGVGLAASTGPVGGVLNATVHEDEHAIIAAVEEEARRASGAHSITIETNAVQTRITHADIVRRVQEVACGALGAGVGPRSVIDAVDHALVQTRTKRQVSLRGAFRTGRSSRVVFNAVGHVQFGAGNWGG